MKNFINVNLRTSSKSALKSILEHNLDRKKQGEDIDYLLKKEDSLGVNHFMYDFQKALKKRIKEEDYFLVSKRFEDLESERLEKTSQRVNNGDYLQKHLVEFVVSLSEEQAKEYLEQGKDLSLGVDNFVNNLKEKYNIETLVVSEHFDEGYYKDNKVVRNYHYHLVAYNYSLENMKSFASNLKRQDYRDLQDLASVSFKSANLDFDRGVSKLISKKEHLERNDFIIQKQKEELKELYTNANKVKNEFKEVRNLFEKGTQEYENLNSIVKNLQEEEKKLRESYKLEVENQQQQKDLISSFAKDFIVKNTTLTNGKREISNSKDFYQKLIYELEKFKKIDIQNLDYNNTKNYEQKLLNTNKILVEENIKLKEELKLVKENFKISQDKNFNLENELVENITKKESYRNFIKDSNLVQEYKIYKAREFENIENVEREI